MIVDAALVPGSHLDAEAIEAGAKRMRQDATAVRQAGTAVVGAWQGLGACYETDHTDQVLRALDPVRSATGKLADDLEQVARALDRFADDVRSLQTRRAGLVARIGDFNGRAAAEADTFGGPSLPGNSVGLLNPQLHFENETLLGHSRLLGEEFETAELECANKIKTIGSPATMLEKAGNWIQDLATGVGNAWSDTVDDVNDGWESFTQAAEDVWDDTTDWFGGRIDAIATGVGQGRQWIDDRAADLGNWYEDTTTDVSDWYEDTTADISGWYEDVTDPNSWPSTAEWAADELMKAGQELTNPPIPGWHSRVFDDGVAHAGEPVPRTVDLDPRRNEVPYGLDGLTGGVDLAYEDGRNWPGREQSTKGLVRVTTMHTPDGPRVVVSVPGTQEWGPVAGDNPMDVTSDLATMSGSGQATVSEAVRLAMDKADIPDGAQVMMVGHSLGGITVAHLLEDPEFAPSYNVTHAMTYGSPIDTFRIDRGIHVTQIQHDLDIVPRTDLDDDRAGFGAPEVDRGPHQSKIVLDSPEAFWEAKKNHETYTDSLRAKADDPRLVAYEQELRDAGFLLALPPTQPGPWSPGEAPVATPWIGAVTPQVSVQNIPVERKFDQ